MRAALICGALAMAWTGAGLSYLRGPQNPEDIIALPGGHTLIASGFADPKMAAGKLYLIDAEHKTFSVLAPRTDAAPWPEYSGCPSRLDPSLFRPHGIALSHSSDGRRLLYVVNHGGRESIEMFAVAAAESSLALTWVGCVPLPDGASGNGVAGLPDGGFVATQFFDKRRGDWIAQMSALEKTGAVYAWHPQGGFTELPGSRASGDNGIEVTADGRWAFVNLWPEKRILKLSLDGSSPASSIPIDFMPDNIHSAPDGALLVGGHVTDFRTLMACKREQCPVDWALARLDPRTLRIEYLMWEKGTPAFEGVTGAAQSGNQLWLSTFRGDRLGIAELPSAPLR